MAKTMRGVQVPRAGGPFELVERDIPEPQPGWVRIKVDACGVCHSDSLIKEGLWPGIQYPRVPGHEVIGVGRFGWRRSEAWERWQAGGGRWAGREWGLW